MMDFEAKARVSTDTQSVEGENEQRSNRILQAIGDYQKCRKQARSGGHKNRSARSFLLESFNDAEF